MKNLIVIIALCVPMVLFARLGETVEEIQKRYGGPIATNKVSELEARTYHFKDYSVQVAFKNNKSVREEITPRPVRFMSGAECLGLIEGVAGKGKWETDTKEVLGDIVRRWVCFDLKSRADQFSSEGPLVIANADYFDHASAVVQHNTVHQAEADKKKADGF